jgi:NAD(P)-dependent dehydrogenase (short-subunit alcohol dehydrogenase family)
MPYPKDFTAIITGAGYGIGRATAQLLAADGWQLLLIDCNEGLVQETTRLVREAGGRADALVGDVTNASTFSDAIRHVRASSAPLKGLVTCAAMRHAGSIADISEAQWDETVSVVLKGVFLACKAAVPEMKANRGGSIVNVSSTDAHGRRSMIAYASAKSAVETLSLCLAADHLADRIRVNVVVPSFTLTGMTEHYSQERLSEIAGRSVAGRVAEPNDPAQLISFLMSAEGETFTGGIFGAQPLPAR